MRRRAGLGVAFALSFAVFREGVAHAGGFELPDNGTQALGRGAAFVAKADDPTAIYWNPAGLARQRGTRLLVDANVYLHSFSFQRAGVFPDDPNDPATPWGGQPYPKVQNTAGPFVAPFFALASDFATFDRLTAAVGLFGPPVIGNTTFPLGVANAPAASRYDYVQSRSTIVYPTASVAYRIFPWLDVGASAHLVLASFAQTTISYSEVSAGQCKNPEYQLCDSRGDFSANATSFAGTFGVNVRPSESLAFGAMVRTPIGLTATGTFTPEAPRIAPIMLQPGTGTLYTNLPLMARIGARYISMDGDFELYDLELDVTYEAWAAAQGDGPHVQIPNLGEFTNIDADIVHRYKDTYGIRAGGAYNLEALGGVLSIRAGGYYDSPATDFAYTRVDFDTLTKIAGTFGLGYKVGAFGFDLGYAAVASIPRTVGSGIGDIHPVNGAQNGKPVDGAGNLLPAVNEGVYRGFTNILSVGATVTFDGFFGPPRKIHYCNRYEPNCVGPAGAEAAPTKPPP
ncbi:MAG TPA: outer membrane protein transport protein, partial [Labilithrix sp.]